MWRVPRGYLGRIQEPAPVTHLGDSFLNASAHYTRSAAYQIRIIQVLAVKNRPEPLRCEGLEVFR
jgi:hypothetical protein